MNRKLQYMLTIILCFAGLAQAAGYIWVEGEAPQSQNMTRHPWWYDKVKTDLLSNGDFISNWSAKPGEATYTFMAPAAKEYVFWVRANTSSTKLSYKLGNGEWQLIDTTRGVGNINIAADDKPDLRFVAWVK